MPSPGFIFLITFLCACLKPWNCSPLLRHGPNHPDDIALDVDDESTFLISTLVPFYFYENSYTSIWITTNGFFGFGDYTDCCFSNFPYDKPMIAPLWDDWEAGILYYRQTTTDDADLEAATVHIKSIFPAFSTFRATWALVATWSYFILWRTGDMFSNFQGILTTDGTNSFAIFLYDRIDDVNTATVGINAGDGINFLKLCGTATPLMDTLPLMRQNCRSEVGVFAFRMDSNNPNQSNYDCTPILSSTGDPKASYLCQWGDSDHSSINVTFILTKPQTCGLMAWDTQKYKAGEKPDLSDSSCEVLYTDEPTMFTFTVDPDSAAPACGVQVTGTTVKTLTFTIRAYYSDARFDTADDRIFQFSCSTDTALPASVVAYKGFNDIQVTQVPIISRTVHLQVTSPYSDDVYTAVVIGQQLKLRVIYNNTVYNIEPYGVYVTECTAADTNSFDKMTVQLIQNGCVVEQNPDKVWYMSRAFQQTSLSPEGLFIGDSGTMNAAKFVTQDRLFLRCLINFCYYPPTVPNLCTDSCPALGRKKRSSREKDVKSYAIYTSVMVSLSKDGSSGLQHEDDSCIDEVFVYSLFSALGFIITIDMIVSFVLFCKIMVSEHISFISKAGNANIVK